MAGRLIRGSSPESCWKTLRNEVNDYWTRLTQAGSNRGVIAPLPVVKTTSSVAGSLSIGGDLMRGHKPMATSEEIAELFESNQHNGVLLGQPPRALLLGIQELKVEREQDKTYALRTTWYKYGLFVRPTVVEPLEKPEWFAIRLECDSRIGWNSWLLNHPIHHVHFGPCEELRLLSPRGRSLISLVDMALRFFAVRAWSEMYPSLYLELSEESGRFAAYTQLPCGAETTLGQKLAEGLHSILRESRAAGPDWHKELVQWREDIDDRSHCAPELFEFFAEELELA